MKNTMLDFLTAIILGLAIAALALEWFDVLIK
jgi:hypothetical protein